jgi:hypothetical protein
MENLRNRVLPGDWSGDNDVAGDEGYRFFRCATRPHLEES